MIVVFVMAATLWGIGSLMRMPLRARVFMLALLWAAVVLAHVILPADAGLRIALGGDARIWGVLGAVVVLGFGYRSGVRGLRARAMAAALPPAVDGAFSGSELDRYARHIMLREIGGPGQRRLKNAKVLVIGAGGLGAPVLLYLAASGVGVLGVIDDDVVESSNLQRQIIHTDQRLGMDKVQSALIAVAALNPFVTLRPYKRRLTAENAAALFADYDLILDGTDNFETRYLVNRTAVSLGKPLIAAAITQWEGQMSLYDPARGAPCFQCVFPQAPAPGMVPSCAEAGVAAPLPGVIGTMMAMEAVKEITGAGLGLRGRLLIHDALYGESRMIGIKPRADCPICGQAH